MKRAVFVGACLGEQVVQREPFLLILKIVNATFFFMTDRHVDPLKRSRKRFDKQKHVYREKIVFRSETHAKSICLKM